MLMAALAVNAWSSQSFGEFEDSASSSRPWQAEQTVDASAIIETLAELDAEDAAHERTAIALAGLAPNDILLSAVRRPQAADLLFRPNDAIVFPHKTGPPPA